MIFKLRSLSREEILFFFAFSIVYSGAFGISNLHQQVFSHIRNFFAVASTLLFFITLFQAINGRLLKGSPAFLATYIAFVLYGVIISYIYGGSVFFQEDIITNIFLAITVIYGFAIFQVVSLIYEDRNRWSLGMPTISVFVTCCALIVLATGGISLSPLSLNFENIEGGAEVYGQGFTKICAIAGVYFFVIATNIKRKPLTIYGLAFAFLTLSLLGGSRGDILAGAIALPMFLLRRPNALNITLVASGILIIFVLFIQSGTGSHFAVFNRFLQLSDGDYSMRDILFGQAYDLILSDSCVIFGCGFNYFQVFYNYVFGLYPHNIFLEAILTFGALFGLSTVLLAIYGAVSLYVRIGNNPIFYILVVDLVSLQKSSSLIDFTALPTLICFAWFGGRALLAPPSRHAYLRSSSKPV